MCLTQSRMWRWGRWWDRNSSSREMVCGAQCDGWGLTLNVILTQTSPHIMMCVKISPWGHSIISLIDIQRGDKTWHFSSNGFCPFFVLFLMDKVFKVMSKTGLWRYTLWIGYVGPFSWGNLGRGRPGTLEYSYQRWDTIEYVPAFQEEEMIYQKFVLIKHFNESSQAANLFNVQSERFIIRIFCTVIAKIRNVLIHGKDIK